MACPNTPLFKLERCFLCFFALNQVGLELMTRDYDMESSSPFKHSDIISVVPVCKVRYMSSYVVIIV